MHRPYRIVGFLGVMLLWTSVASAQWQGQSERTLSQCVPQDALMARGEAHREQDLPLSIVAQSLISEPNRPIEATSGVVVTRGDQRLETEAMTYDPKTGLIELPVLVYYTDAFIAIGAQSATLRINTSQGDFSVVDYRIAGAQGSGHAEVVELVSQTQAKLRRFDFTTCDPTDPDWQLIAKSVDLDLEESVGVARGARLEFKGIPLFYLPWFSFPLNDERKSGFLYPRFGVSSSDGLDLSIPWYWNIAPNYDATFTPRWIQDRGTMLGTEFRFLLPSQNGRAEVAVLPNDQKTKSNRYYAQLDYQNRLASNWSLNARLRRVSDEQYFLDLGGGLNATAIQYVRSNATARGRGRFWTMTIGADFFQVLDDRIAPQNEPYRRLPRMQLSINRPLISGLYFDMDNELVHFDRDEGITGSRLDVYPKLKAEWIRPGGFLKASAGARWTGYSLQNAAVESPSRSTPILSLDGGLIFERHHSDKTLQTLEPRIYYLYVPRKDQTDLPIFDTGNLTFGFSQLFHDNRFSGADRQSDANQVTVALTSRWIDATTGRSRADFNIGQVFYFDDRAVQLPNRPIDSVNQSALVAESNWTVGQSMRLRAGLQWDASAETLDVAYAGLDYRGSSGLQGAVAYRFRDQWLDQVDARIRYPLTEAINLIGRGVYSFKDNQSLELFGGIEYESCCWAVRLTAREYIWDRSATQQTAIFLELHLKGLGSLGRQPYPLF